MSIADKDVSIEDLAWLAGFIDGEGSFFLHRHPNKKQNYVSYGPTLSITNTDYGLLEKVQKIVGWGGIYSNNFRPEYKNRKPRWIWNISGHPRVGNVFECIRPWMGLFKVEKALDVLIKRSGHKLDQTYEEAQNIKAIRDNIISSDRATLRKRLNLTQEQLAKKLNVGRSTVGNWENDRCCVPQGDLAKRYSDILNSAKNARVD